MPLESAIQSLAGIGTPECHAWRIKILVRYQPIASYLARTYRRIANQHGYVKANRWLLDQSKALYLGGTRLKLTASSEEIEDYCKTISGKVHRKIHQTGEAAGIDVTIKAIRSVVEEKGLKFPLEPNSSHDEKLAALARTCDPKWWKRGLQTKRREDLENALRTMQVISKKGDIYVSELTLQNRLQQKKRNRDLLEKLEAENEEGQVYTLAELSDLSTSNPLLRRNELMVRLNGFEAFADNSEEKYTAMFYTLTCPSKFHPIHSNGHINEKYNGSTVSQAQNYLNKVWQRIRAYFDRHGIDVFGMRVAEPHHDGTPHWHFLLFIESRHVERVTATFARYALQEDGDEPGAKKHRFKAERINPEKGTATGYIAKYISKNIDGYQVGEDQYGRAAVISAIRIEAWASTHRIRQFDQIGGAGITVYRELRRLDAAGLPDGLLRDLTQAADAGDWEAYTRLMGGVHCSRKDRPLRPMRIAKEQRNPYGEIVKAIKGLWFGTVAVITRIHTWAIRMRADDNDPALESEDGIGPGTQQSIAPPLVVAPLEYCQ